MDSSRPKRQLGRREEDFLVREQNSRFHTLCEIGKAMTAEIEIRTLFPLVMSQTNKIMGTQRSSLFLYDKNKNELWSLVSRPKSFEHKLGNSFSA